MARTSPEYVRWLQRSLNTVLGITLPVSGVPDPATQATVRRFQLEQGLDIDGVVGANTELALRAAGAEPPPGTPPAAPLPAAPLPRPGGTRLRDSRRLASVALRAATPMAIDAAWPAPRRRLAATYNRLGGLMTVLAEETTVDARAGLCVWAVESRGAVHVPGQAIVRFENHLFWERWGRGHAAVYEAHFRCGGHAGQPGRPWEGHQFCEAGDGVWQPCHTDQAGEYRLLALARRLAGDDAALPCLSIGGPQILVSNWDLLGYTSSREMWDAFQADERAHVLGFFDFCREAGKPQRGDLLRYLRERRWRDVAFYYNGSGQVEAYAKILNDNYEEALALPIA